jgi:hypothetical protein
MSRQYLSACCAGMVAFIAACGEAPQPFPVAPDTVKQHFSFTAVAEPAAGRFQIVTQPQPALSAIPQDANGNALSVDSGKIQLYSSNVAFASSPFSATTGCASSTAPLVMYGDVELFSGFKEQLRNVYVRITSISGSQTFCNTKPSVGTFGATLNPNVGLYLYAPLDNGHIPGFTMPKRSQKWGLQLLDNSTFWFNGEIWAEIIPALPTITKPANGARVRGEPATTSVAMAWKEDKNADGTTPAGTVVPRPTGVGSEITIWRCNTATANAAPAFDAAACTTLVDGPAVQAGEAYAPILTTGYWYQWDIRPAFRLPGDPTLVTVGTQVIRRNFKTTFP